MYSNRHKLPGITRLSRRCLAAVVAVVFVLSGGLFGPVAVRAEGIIRRWIGPEGGLWETGANWDPVGVPENGDTVRIPEYTLSGASSVVGCVYANVSVTLECAGKLTVSGGTLGLIGTSKLTGGKLDGAGNIVVTGQGSQLTWQGGDIQGTGSFTVGTGAKLEVKGATTKTLARPLSCPGDIYLNDAGTLNLSGGGQVDGNIVLAYATTLGFTGGGYVINGSLSETGNGASISVDAGSAVFNGTYTIKNTTVKADATGTWNVSTTLPFLSVSGNAVFNNDVEVAGLVLLPSGRIDGGGTITLISGTNKWLQGGTIAGTGDLVVQVSGSENLTVSGPCSISRHLENNGSLLIGNGGSLGLSGGAGGTGSLRIQDGGILRIGAGSYSFGGPGQVINDGMLAISDACSKVQLNTYLSQQSVTGMLAFDIGQGGRFCKLEIPDNAALINGSQLEINLVDDFVPEIGGTFEVMTYKSCSGRFASITSNAEGFVFETTYGQDALTLTVAAATETDPPVWADGYPQATDVTTSGFKLKTQIDEVGTAFYVILDDGASAPDATQVKSGRDSTGNLVAYGRRGFTNLSANSVGSANIAGLTSGTAYDVYVVAQDQAGNLQDTPATLHITTTSETLSDEAEIETYSLLGQVGSIDSGTRTIAVTVPYNTEVTALVATFTLSSGASATVGEVEQVSGTTANNFTNPVVYTVTAEDGTTKTWTVTVTEAAETVPPVWAADYPQATDVTTSGFTLKAKIDEAGKAYYVVLRNEAAAPNATQVKAGQDSADSPLADGRKGSISLTVDVEGSVSISGLDSETEYDIYVVAEDAVPNLQAAPVKLDVRTLKILSDAAEIETYSLLGQVGSIDSGTRTIAVTVPYNTDVTALVATFTLSSGASAKVGEVAQVSGSTANNFTEPVTYTVTAEDGTTTKAWTVAVTVDSEFAGGDGTEGSPYLVATADQLNNVRNHFDSYFKQTADIDLDVAPYNQGEGWVPIGIWGTPFTGTYDGNGKTISGLRINRASDSDAGLFGAAKGATFRNLTLADVGIQGGNEVGGLAGVVTELGTLTAPTKIEDVHLISGSVSGTSFVGGLVGTLGGSEIRRSTADCSVSGVEQCVGGLVGLVNASATVPATISECHATGNVTVSGTGSGQSVGGLVGDVPGSCTITVSYASGNVTGKKYVGGLVGHNAGEISRCYAVGAVGGADSIGGLVGHNYGGQISRCFASGAAKGFSDDAGGTGYGIGGLVGKNVLGGTVDNCYAMGAVQGVSQVGGLVGRNPYGSITCTYATGSVSATGYGHGGLIGEGSGDKSYWDKETSGCETSAGSGVVGKTTVEMKQQTTYVDWDFEETWGLHPSQNSGYPFLIGVTEVGPVTPSSEADISAFRFSLSDGVVIDYAAGRVDVLVDSGTDVTDLQATFALSARAAASVGGVNQVSGVTAQDFTSPVTYTVTAEDGTTRNWVVKVSKREDTVGAQEPSWYHRSPWPTTKSLREVKYLNGKFMAVGEVGALVVSSNGVTWTKSDLGVAEPLESIAYGNGKYVAIGNKRTSLDGSVYGSTDGVNWTHLATISNHRLADIVCVNGKFVAVGQSGRILTSRDGATWKIIAASEIKDYLNGIAYAEGTYVAVGDAGVVVTSPDGENWTEQSSLGTDTLRDVTYGNGRFVAVGGYDTACIYSSTDSGETWSKYAFGMTCYGLLRSVEYDGSQFVAVGYRPNAVAPNLFTSADGLTWTRRSGIPSDVSFGSVAGGGDVWVAACFRYGIVTSTDGITWTKLGQGTKEYLSDVAYDGTTFVSVGYKGTIQTSSDGITWTFGDSGTSESLRTVKHLNHKFVAVGDKGTILTSEDGTNWIRETSGTSVELYDVTYGDGKYIAVGGTGSNDVILVSTDGNQWTPVDHDYMIPFVAVTYGNGKFVALGQNGQVYVSSDGTEWPRTYLPGSGNYPRDIIYVNGRFVAVGGYGEVYVSDNDGATWTVQEKVGGVNEYIYSVAYGGGNLVGVTAYGNILISTDKGDSWTAEPSGFDERLHLYGVTAGDEGFVAVGEWGLVLQSKDFGAPGDPDANAVAKDKAALTWDVIAEENTRQDSITGDLVNPLPTSGANGTTISWSVSHGGFINTTTGAVTRPTFTQGDQTVVLTATISKGTASDTVTFMLKVVALDPTPDESITVDLTWLTWNLIRGSNSTEGQVKTGLNLVDSGPHDTTIRWSAEPAGVINTTTGLVTRPAAGQGNAQVRLTAVVSKEGGQDGTKEFELTIIALPSTGSGGGVAPVYYTISAAAGPGGTISPKSASVASYGSQTFTITPDEGYEIEDVLVDGKSVGVVASYTFERINKKHTISAIFKKIEEPVAESPFKDVEETDWFYNSVKYVFENGLMTGTSTDIFNPLLDTNRAMIVTILHRLRQTPDAPANIFADVDEGTWYTGAVAWAAANGIVKGYGGGLFGPTDSVTREQLACILYNYARYAGYDVSQSVELTGFVDGGSTSDWAVEAMQWAVGSGLIRGKGNGLLDPTGPAIRAEVAAILERFIEGNAK